MKKAFLTASINLTKVDKSKLYKSKSGESYLNLTINILEKPTTYGAQMAISQDDTKSGDKGNQLLGWGKFITIDGKKVSDNGNSGSKNDSTDDDDDLGW